MHRATKTGLLVIGICLSLGWSPKAEAATKPHYDFYSTSMLSSGKQQGYSSSRITQSGTVKVKSSNVEWAAGEWTNGRKANVLPQGEVFSADLFHRAAVKSIGGGGSNSEQLKVAAGSHHSGGRGINYTTPTVNVSLSALKITRQNADNLEMAAAAVNEAGGRPSHNRYPGTPGSGGTPLPVGDALLPLLLMAAAYAALRFFRRKKNMNSITL